MHVHPLSIASVPIQYRRDDHELLLRDEIPYAPLVLGGFMLLNGVQVELEGGGEGEDEEEQERAGDRSQ
jgi:hypothetical protein